MARQGRTLPKEGMGISHLSHQQKWDFNFFCCGLLELYLLLIPHPSLLFFSSFLFYI